MENLSNYHNSLNYGSSSYGYTLPDPEDSQFSTCSRASNKSVSKVSLKAAIRDAEKEKKKACINSVKVKFLIDLAQTATDTKDELEKLFSDCVEDAGILTEEKFSYCSMKSSVPGLIRWTRMSADLLQTCKSASDVSSYEPFALILFPREQFLELVLESLDGIDFDALGKYMGGVQRTIVERDMCPAGTKTIIALLDLERLYVKAQNRAKKSRPECRVTQWVDSAIAYLIYECNVEIVCHKKPVDFAEYLHTLCRCIDRFEGEELVTELDFVQKETKLKPDDSFSADQLELHERKQAWAAMLQTIPGISAKKANHLIASSQFSCFKRTFDALNDASVPAEKRACLLQQCFGVTKKGVAKNEAVVARKVYHFMTTADGRTKIGGEKAIPKAAPAAGASNTMLSYLTSNV